MQNGELMYDEFRMFYFRGEAKGSHGIEVLLGPRVRDKMISVRYVDNQMIVVRLSANLHST